MTRNCATVSSLISPVHTVLNSHYSPPVLKYLVLPLNKRYLVTCHQVVMRSHRRENFSAYRFSGFHGGRWWEIREGTELPSETSFPPTAPEMDTLPRVPSHCSPAVPVYSGRAPDPYSLFQSSLPTRGIFTSQKTKSRVDLPHSKCGRRHTSPAGWDFCWSKEAFPPPSYLVIKRHSPPRLTLTGAKKETFDPFRQVSSYPGFACEHLF